MQIALSLPVELRESLRREAGRFGHAIVAEPPTAELLVVALNELDPQLVVAAASPHHLTASLIDACDLNGVPIMVIAVSAVERRHASALGIIDTIDEASWHRLTPIDGAAPAVRAVAAAAPVASPTIPGPPEPRAAAAAPIVPAPTSAARPRGSVVAVWGPGGAPGRTSIAIAVAAEFAAIGTYTALGDADTHAAAVAPALGLLDEAPGFAAACRLAGVDGLSAQEFERIGEFHRAARGGFWVLTGIGRPSRWPELSADRVAGAIAAAREWVDVLVIDTAASLEQDEELSSDLAAPRRNAATLEVLRRADRVIAVAGADPIGLSRFLRSYAELLELVPAERVTVVVNKVRASAVGAGAAAQLRQTLSRFGGIDDPVLVPWDPAAFDSAVLSGRPLADAAPRSAARIALRKLVAEQLIPGRQLT